jgi:hypothetical protein
MSAMLNEANAAAWVQTIDAAGTGKGYHICLNAEGILQCAKNEE